MRHPLVGLLPLFALSSTASASITSSIDQGDEGWTIVGLAPDHHNQPVPGLPVTFTASFGSPRGSIEAGEIRRARRSDGGDGFVSQRAFLNRLLSEWR